MAKKVDDEKGFLVIEVSAAELSAKAGGYGICDYCNTPCRKGVLYSRSKPMVLS